jgi:hypothetical protein
VRARASIFLSSDCWVQFPFGVAIIRVVRSAVLVHCLAVRLGASSLLVSAIACPSGEASLLSSAESPVFRFLRGAIVLSRVGLPLHRLSWESSCRRDPGSHVVRRRFGVVLAAILRSYRGSRCRESFCCSLVGSQVPRPADLGASLSRLLSLDTMFSGIEPVVVAAVLCRRLLLPECRSTVLS